MKVTVELLSGNEKEPPTKNDIDKNIDAIDRAMGNCNSLDWTLLNDTKSNQK